MKKISLLILAITAFCAESFAQAAYISPSPTGKNDTITLYIDVAQSTGSNGALKLMLDTYPDQDVYLWTWQPAGPTVGNGDWGNSNEAMKMTHVSGKLYSMRFKPTSYYNVDAASFFNLGISCLAKFKDGNSYPGQFGGEAKTEDLHVNIIPRLCDDIFCVFPEIAKQGDFVSITYDNTQETIAGLQNMGDDECYIYLYGITGIFTGIPYVATNLVTSTPALKMKRVPGTNKFRFTFIPSDFLPLNGASISGLKYYIMRPGFTYQGAPPIQAYTFADCP
jgi:hypothetical protein